MSLTQSVLQRAAQQTRYDLLRVYTYYRTLLGSLLLLMFQSNLAPSILGNDHPRLFLYTSLAYTALNLITLVFLWRVKFSPSVRQLFVLLCVDTLAILLLLHASGGALSGLGYLLLVVVAAGGMVLPSRLALLLAALASIGVIGESLARFWMLGIDNRTLFSAGTLGALLFFTAFIFRYLTRKIRRSNEEAAAQARQAAHLQELAQRIVERMRTGILVLNHDQHVELYNRAALDLLGLDAEILAGQGQKRPNRQLDLADLPTLAQHFAQWRQNQQQSPVIPIEGSTTSEVKVNFASLESESKPESESGSNAGTLVFIEDNRIITQQAQQLKLASLGRLTASIAHEIRNPLGAISHAGQLLQESAHLSNDDQKLLRIINNHSKRVNQIIENVLQISRRRNTNPQQVALEDWLPQFIEDYKTQSGEDIEIELELHDTDIRAKFDPSQLQQVLTNLCDNGLRYSIKQTGRARLRLEAGVGRQSEQPYIRVLDWGEGIAPENQDQVFVPFFTTESTGSGLGLYICQELCEANQALINYQISPEGLSCFHIQLAHPERAL